VRCVVIDGDDITFIIFPIGIILPTLVVHSGR